MKFARDAVFETRVDILMPKRLVEEVTELCKAVAPVKAAGFA